LLLCWRSLWCLGVLWWSFPGLLGIRSCHLQTGVVWLLPFLFEFLYFFFLSYCSD
jgi:hypothetical protein